MSTPNQIRRQKGPPGGGAASAVDPRGGATPETVGFLRDAESFTALSEIVWGTFSGRSDEEAVLRVWLTGCGRGEDAYSLVICLLESLDQLPCRPSLRVFATDASESAIAAARAGIYEPAALAGMSSDRRERFFTQVESGFHVDKPLRDHCVFARHDVLRDPPFSRLDVVVCREPLHAVPPQSLLSIFHYALKPDGYLLFCPGAKGDPTGGLFTVVDARHQIFVRGTSASRLPADLPGVEPETVTADAGAVPIPVYPGFDLVREVERVAVQVSRLKDELAAKDTYLSSIFERHDARNESLQAFNARISTSNTDLQTANAELETAKQMLRTTNQELVSVNEELSSRMQAAVKTNDDLLNLFDSVDIPLVVVGQDLRIRRVTPSAQSVLNILPSDVGQPIGRFKPSLDIDNLEPLIHDVLKNLQVLEREVIDRVGRWFRMVIRPYKTFNHRIDGVVVTLLDISAVKWREQDMKAARDFAVNVVETMREPLVVLDPELQIRAANHAFYQTFRLNQAETLGEPIYRVGGARLAIPSLPNLLREVLAGGAPLADYELEHEVAELGTRSLLVSAHPILQSDTQSPQLILLAIEDITQRKLDVVNLRKGQVQIQAVDTALDGIITIDRSGTVESFNLAASSIFGYRAEEVIGRNVSMLMPEPFSGEHDRYLADYARTGQANILGRAREVSGRRKDGSVFPLELAVAEIDELGHFTGFARDLSLRKKLEREVLEAAASEQQRIGQELHDSVGQRLTGLRYMIETLTSRGAPKGRDDALIAKIGDEIKNTLVDVRQIARGLIPFTVDADGLATSLESLTAYTQQVFGIECAFEFEAGVVASNDLTASQLYHIAQEAMLNAVKHGAAGHILVSLGTNFGSLELKVIDDGCGIDSPEKHRRGSGLQIMFYRASAIGATLRVSPREPRGTEVVCTLNQYGLQPTKKLDQ